MLNLNEPISRYLSELQSLANGVWNQITCEHLHTHTAGLVRVLNLRGKLATVTSGLQKVQRLSQEDLFIGEPGRYHSYIHIGYVLVVGIVERYAAHFGLSTCRYGVGQ